MSRYKCLLNTSNGAKFVVSTVILDEFALTLFQVQGQKSESVVRQVYLLVVFYEWHILGKGGYKVRCKIKIHSWKNTPRLSHGKGSLATDLNPVSRDRIVLLFGYFAPG